MDVDATLELTSCILLLLLSVVFVLFVLLRGKAALLEEATPRSMECRPTIPLMLALIPTELMDRSPIF
jgi:hypothetical protein